MSMVIIAKVPDLTLLVERHAHAATRSTETILNITLKFNVYRVFHDFRA
jgi:hypothetical protein